MDCYLETTFDILNSIKEQNHQRHVLFCHRRLYMMMKKCLCYFYKGVSLIKNVVCFQIIASFILIVYALHQLLLLSEELIKDGLTLDVVECRITDFPRLRYHNKLMKGLGDRFTELFQGDVQHVRFKDFVHWKQTNENPTIYLAGQDLDRKYSLVSKYKRHRVNIGTKGS